MAEIELNPLALSPQEKLFSTVFGQRLQDGLSFLTLNGKETFTRIFEEFCRYEATPREATILRLRFGFDQRTVEEWIARPGHDEPKSDARTLKEVRNYFGNISIERVRQIEWKAIRKLRHPYYSRRLRRVERIPGERQWR